MLMLLSSLSLLGLLVEGSPHSLFMLLTCSFFHPIFCKVNRLNKQCKKQKRNINQSTCSFTLYFIYTKLLDGT